MRSRASARSGASIRETGKRNFVIVQCEDELAAIGAVIGAMWNGARAFTPTSGPGISLMNEFIGLAYYAEVPAVIFDIQRVGPSTGMPTRTQQCDLMLAAYASHGDTRHVLLFPNSPEECFYMSVQAFDLAERLQTPVFVMSDLDIGMNDWMCPDAASGTTAYRPDRGKVLTKEQIEKLDKFHRYLDKDGDAIPYRTLPGVHPKGAYFTRGSGHTQYGGYTEDSTEYQIVLDRLKRKFDTAKTLVPKAAFDGTSAHDVGIVSLGSCDGAVQRSAGHPQASRRAARLHARAQLPVRRRRSRSSSPRTRMLFVVEQNRDAQLREPADAGNRRREGQAALDPALQRPADVLERASSTACSPNSGDAPSGQRADSRR